LLSINQYPCLAKQQLAMVVVSRLLSYRANRWANSIAASITIVFVIGGESTTLHDIFLQR
jgi:hypothetical protein